MGKWMQRKLFVGGKASFFLGMSLLTVCFLIGMLGGRVSAGKNSESALSELYRYLTGYYALDVGEESSIGIFLNALFIYFRYPLLAFLMGFTIPGTLLLPVLSAAFGFFLSYAACCFARIFGGSGVLLAAAVLGLRCLVTLPCFFILAVQALHGMGGMVSQHKKPVMGLERWLVCCVVAAILLAGTLAERIFSPVLIERVLQMIWI